MGFDGAGMPPQSGGRYYNGGEPVLLLLTEYKRYKTPIFLTYKQAQDEEINVKKGEKSFPVYFWYLYAIPKDQKDGKGMPYEKYARLSDEQKKAYKLLPLLRYYSVFNIDQTDMPEKNPERYARLLEQAAGMPQTDGTTCAEVDHMVDAGKWYCRIEVLESDSAFYRPSADIIVCPLKTQFPKGADYYSTLLHEVAHSTGHPSRLNRDMSGFFGSPSYAREELIAEMTAALCGIRFVRACDNAAAGKRRLPRKLAAGAERETRIPVRNPYRREQGRDDDCRPGRAMQRQTRRNSRVNRIITGRGSLRPQYPKL